MEDYNNPVRTLATIGATLLMALGIYLAVNAPIDDAGVRTTIVPTLQPTPPLVVPTPRPTIDVVYESRQTTITINQDVDVNICVGLCK